MSIDATIVPAIRTAICIPFCPAIFDALDTAHSLAFMPALLPALSTSDFSTHGPANWRAQWASHRPSFESTDCSTKRTAFLLPNFSPLDQPFGIPHAAPFLPSF